MRTPLSFNPRPISAAIAAAAIALLGAPAARATITVEINGSTAIYDFGLAACEATDTANYASTVTVTYTNSTTVSTTSGYTLSAFSTTDGSCSTKPTTSTEGKLYAVSTTSTGGSFDVVLSDLLLGTACSASTASAATPGTVYICVTLDSGSTVEDSGFIEVQYATVPPDPPLLSSIEVEPGDQQLHVSWTEEDTSITVLNNKIYCEPDATDGGSPVFDIDDYAADVTSGTTATVDKTGISQMNLVDGQSYAIAITTTDSFGNESALSQLSTGNVPEPVADFYGDYRNDGGSALGCASSDGVTWLGLVAVFLWLLFRARRGGAARAKGAGGALLGLAIGSSLLSAGAARAEDIDYNGTNFTTTSARAPRRFFVGLEFDKYTPQVDSEHDLNGATPYTDIFHSRVPWRAQGEFSIELVHTPFGSGLGGVSGGFWQNIGKGIFSGGPQAGQVSSDTTLLDVWPVGLEVQWRFDMFADRMRWFPLIPYAKAGLMGGIWAVYKGNGDIATTAASSATATSPAREAGRGQGITYGYTTALGLAVSLDALSPDISNEAYLDLGLQRTSVFAEYGWTRLDDFRRAGALILSDRSWRVGLSLEF